MKNLTNKTSLVAVLLAAVSLISYSSAADFVPDDPLPVIDQSSAFHISFAYDIADEYLFIEPDQGGVVPSCLVAECEESVKICAASDLFRSDSIRLFGDAFFADGRFYYVRQCGETWQWIDIPFGTLHGWPSLDFSNKNLSSCLTQGDALVSMRCTVLGWTVCS